MNGYLIGLIVGSAAVALAYGQFGTDPTLMSAIVSVITGLVLISNKIMKKGD